MLDIVSPEVAVGWTEPTPVNPGPHQFHADAACVRAWMRERGYYFCRRGEVREIMRPIALPLEPPAGACATASTATTTSSSRPDRLRRAPRDAARGLDARSGRPTLARLRARATQLYPDF